MDQMRQWQHCVYAVKAAESIDASSARVVVAGRQLQSSCSSDQERTLQRHSPSCHHLCRSHVMRYDQFTLAQTMANKLLI